MVINHATCSIHGIQVAMWNVQYQYQQGLEGSSDHDIKHNFTISIILVQVAS